MHIWKLKMYCGCVLSSYLLISCFRPHLILAQSLLQFYLFLFQWQQNSFPPNLFLAFCQFLTASVLLGSFSHLSSVPCLQQISQARCLARILPPLPSLPGASHMFITPYPVLVSYICSVASYLVKTPCLVLSLC